MLSALDPEGVKRRSQHRLIRRKYQANGPIFIWHIDGSAKGKLFGFCINGAIDDYNRSIMWLEVDHSSSNPCAIAKYFLKTVRSIGGTASAIRGNYDTENVHVAAQLKQ